MATEIAKGVYWVGVADWGSVTSTDTTLDAQGFHVQRVPGRGRQDRPG